MTSLPADSAPWPANGTPLIIGIAGGSGSGKTTIAEAVIEEIGPADAVLLKQDSYYRELGHLALEARAKVNFDHPDSIENELLVAHVAELQAGRAIEKPRYDFTAYTRRTDTERVEPRPVVIIEGILALIDPALRERMDLKIYVDTDADIRLMRRLERDITERGRSVESVLAQYRDTVRPMHLQFVEPSKRYSDLIIPEGYNVGAVGTVVSMIRHLLASQQPAEAPVSE